MLCIRCTNTIINESGSWPTVFIGLDAFQADWVMETFHQLAQEGHTVLCSIHQPRGSIYAKFDEVVLLSEGSVVYRGPAQEEPLSYFSKFGFHCPDHVNPAEFLADLISVDYTSSESIHSLQSHIDFLVETFSRSSSNILYQSSVFETAHLKIPPRFSRKSITRQRWLVETILSAPKASMDAGFA